LLAVPGIGPVTATALIAEIRDPHTAATVQQIFPATLRLTTSMLSLALYGVKGTEMSMMTLPGLVLLLAVALATAPVVMRRFGSIRP
jgi:transposase